MQISQNSWPVIATDDTVSWQIPTKKGPRRSLRLRDGHVGFVLTWFALWFHEKIEPLNLGIWDEWAYAYRYVRGQYQDYSNHASGTAIDLNATLHPLGKSGTFKYAWQYARIRAKLIWLGGVIRWGGNYVYRKDEMHFEIDVEPRSGKVLRLARRLAKTNRGRRVLNANPHYNIDA